MDSLTYFVRQISDIFNEMCYR